MCCTAVTDFVVAKELLEEVDNDEEEAKFAAEKVSHPDRWVSG